MRYFLGALLTSLSGPLSVLWSYNTGKWWVAAWVWAMIIVLYGVVINEIVRSSDNFNHKEGEVA
jgi:hypothetical protein